MSRVGDAVADLLAGYGVEAEPPSCGDGSWVFRRGPGCSDRS